MVSEGYKRKCPLPAHLAARCTKPMAAASSQQAHARRISIYDKRLSYNVYSRAPLVIRAQKALFG